MLAIIEPETPQQFDDVRQLCWEYRDFLIGLGGKSAQVCLRAYPHDQYDALMQTLETYHARPDGGLRLAIFRGEPVGCGMFQKFEPGTAEIKRVFVREAARGTGAGRGIMNALIRDCRDRGYDRILMDTGKILTGRTRAVQFAGVCAARPLSGISQERVQPADIFRDGPQGISVGPTGSAPRKLNVN